MPGWACGPVTMHLYLLLLSIKDYNTILLQAFLQLHLTVRLSGCWLKELLILQMVLT